MLKIYLKDLKSIRENIIALIVVIGLCILPALYAWFNIKSSWDPYGNLSDISVAIVNNDVGGSIFNKTVNIGEIATKNLEENKTLNFQFVNENEANKGLESGKYYASIEITNDFTKNILSVVEKTPIKPKLIYKVNEKRNAVAPKITDKSASLIQEEISKNFIKEVSSAALEGMKKLDMEIESQIPTIKKFEKILFEVEGKTGEIKESINSFYSSGKEALTVVENVKKKIPEINNAINNGIDIVNYSNNFIDKASDLIKNLSPTIKADLEFIKKTSEDLNKFLDSLSESSEAEILLEKINYIKSKEEILLSKINSIINLIESVNSEKLNNLYENLLKVKNDIENNIKGLDNLKALIESGDSISQGAIEKIKNITENIIIKTDYILKNFDSKYKEDFEAISNDLKNIILTADNVLNEAIEEMPKIKSILDNTSNGLVSGIDVLKFARENMNDAENIIKTTANKIRSLSEDERLEEALEILKGDIKKESDFLSDPVELIKERVYPVPNYGSAMSPFFTTLSLWVGGLILVSVLTTKVYYNMEVTGSMEYFGRLLTFITIGIFQALVVTLGDIFILGTYNYSKSLFVVSGIIISIVFVSIIYTLVYVLGNVGKAIGVILLVLQISSSGGTFPVEVTPPFFKAINPFLPFTYGIGLMREAVAGVVLQSVYKYLFMLSLYIVIFITIGFYISTKNRKLGEKIRNRLKDSGLVEK